MASIMHMIITNVIITAYSISITLRKRFPKGFLYKQRVTVPLL